MTFFPGSFLTNPVKESQQEITDLAYFEGLLNEIIQIKRRIKRAAPAEEQNRKVSLKAGLLESILGKSITPKSETSIRGETVGSLLATIPGILQVHEESYDTIGHQISSVGSGLIAAINSVGEKMQETLHQEAEIMHQDAVEMRETLHQDSVKMNDKLEKLDKTQHDGMHSLMSSFTDEDNNLNGLTEALHDGLNIISMKMPEKSNLEEEVHDGFDSLVESLSNKDELGSIIHDGLHDLSEQIGSKSDVSQVLSLPYFYLLNNGYIYIG